MRKYRLLPADCQNPRRDWKRWMLAYGMILPAMVFFVLFYIYPMINLVILSLYKGNVRNPYKEYLGLENYRSLVFVRADFLPALWHTLYYTAAVVVLLIGFAVIFAVWMQKDRKINSIAQTAFFTPHLVASISCAFIWTWMYSSDSYGLFNSILNFLGLDSIRWLDQTSTAMNCIIVMNVWKSIGYYALIILSALKAIPPEIYEAARLDSASGVKTFFKITLPMLSPQLFFLLITITTGSFMVFDSIRIMTRGGPGASTEVLCTYIYNYAFLHNNSLGLASAGGVILMLFLIILTLIDFKGLERKVYYQ